MSVEIICEERKELINQLASEPLRIEPVNKYANPNWWKRRTALERRLTVFSILTIVAAIALLIGFVLVIFAKRFTERKLSEPTEALVLHGNSSSQLPPTGTGGSICLSADCILTASSVLQWLKPESEPCDDFYEFTCGNFLENIVIPEDNTELNPFTIIDDRLQEQLKEIITEERPLTDPKHLRLPNLLYKACMNKYLLEELDAGPIKKFDYALDGWPVLWGEAWDDSNSWTWQEAVKKFRRIGFRMDYILDFKILPDIKNTTRNVMHIDQPSLGFSHVCLIDGFNETLVTSYFSYMVDIAVLFGADKDVATKELGESLQFEIDLALICLSKEKRDDFNSLYNPSTIGGLQKSYPYVQWLDYINALMPKGLTVDEDEPIIVWVPTFFDELGKLLARTPKRVIANYMMWRIHADSVAFLSDKFVKRRDEFDEYVFGRRDYEKRWKECVDRCRNSLPIAVASLYVPKHFKEDSKLIAMEMVKNIREAYGTLLDELDWMDNKTKKRAKAKLDALATHIGYPDELLNNSRVTEYYQNLDIDPDKYLEALLQVNVLKTDYSFNKLRLPVNRSEWLSDADPTAVNAFYRRYENSIEFPVGILRGSFFNAKRPMYMNYGAIGIFIGHEITHGFDDRGRQYDLEGNLLDWWEPQAEETYLKKAKCIIDQYGNFTEPQTGMKLNGTTPLGENIADNGGVKESYLAYKKWAANNGPEPKLPGLDYTPEQMFWISVGQSMCRKSRKEFLVEEIPISTHSPAYFRVIGPLRNSKYFAKDFHCPEESFMNPVDKCEVW